MELITVFLITLVLALVIGNLLLSLTGGRQAEAEDEASNAPLPDPAMVEPLSSNAVKSKDPGFLAVNEKVMLAHNRLSKLENLLLTNGNSVLTYNLGEKMRKLDHFRANTEVEIKAIKEIIEETAGVKKKKNKKKGNKKENELTTKEMHKIIYKSA